MKNTHYLLLMLLAVCQTGFCQEKTDTAALVKEFKKVMEFGTQPYLYYSTVTKMESEPVIEAQDTATMNGVFYKNGTDLYYKSGPEEVYLQDSLMIQINQQRKTIWISRVDMASKEKLNTMQVGNRQFNELMRKNFTIQKASMANNTARLSFETKQMAGRSAVISTRAGLLFTEKEHLPQQIEIEMRMQQPANDEMIAQIKNQGVDERKLIQLINGQQYLVRMQKMSVAFEHIDHSKEKVMQMPLWKDILDFNTAEQTYTGKAAYAEYEVTKTF